MNWKQLLSPQRFKKTTDGQIIPTSTTSTREGIDALRTDFHIDYDRVVFSGSFRRLGRKTQVHPFAQNDHTHNRLTHSVEVASVGRSLGNRVGVMLQDNLELPTENTAYDIGTVVQVACLAHDMGNPPFGHTGEEALRDWFHQQQNQYLLSPLNEAEKNDICTYEGNAHSLRIVASLEMYHHLGGMRLTAASIGALLKYPWTSSEPKLGQRKFNIYQTELPYIQTIAQELGLAEISANRWQRHPLSYLMEAADDICYALLDLEDAVEIGLISAFDMENILSPLGATENIWHVQNHKQKCAMLRGIAIGKAIDDVAQTFVLHRSDLLAGNFKGKDLIAFSSPEVRDTLENAKELARTRVFRHESKILTEIASFPCLGSILELLVPAAYAYTQGKKLTIRQELGLSLMKDECVQQTDSLYQAYMKILDFVGGMTDNSSARMARELSGIEMI